MQTRSRTRARTDRFTLRGWTFAVHPLQDQGRLAALNTDTDHVQSVTLFSGQTVEIRPGDCDIIFPQIGWPAPVKRRSASTTETPGAANEPPPQPVLPDQPAPDDRSTAAPPAGPVVSEVDARDLENAALKARIAELERGPLNPPGVSTGEESEDSVEAITAKVAELAGAPKFEPKVATPTWGDGGKPIPADLDTPLAAMVDDEPMPDALARLVPPGDGTEKQRLNARFQLLHHRLMDGGRSLEPLSTPETAELNQLQAYAGWFS